MEAVRDALRRPGGLLVSPVTAWEIGLLVSRGRLSLAMDPLVWFSTLLDSGASAARTTPEILIASSLLPGGGLRDPADRIIAATARANGYNVITRDRPLLDFARAGHMRATPC